MKRLGRITLATGLAIALMASALPASAHTATSISGAALTSSSNTAVASTSAEEYTVSIGDAVYDDRDTGLKAMLAAPGCNAGDAESKRVTNWQRRNPSGVAKLVCGTPGYGWRHIAQRHGQDYQNIVTKYQLGRSWDDFAKWAMSTTVGAPQSAPVNTNNNTWSYTAPIQIKNNQGQVVRTYSMLVAVSRSDERIITAFPR